jgi:hypothetical protein
MIDITTPETKELKKVEKKKIDMQIGGKQTSSSSGGFGSQSGSESLSQHQLQSQNHPIITDPIFFPG